MIMKNRMLRKPAREPGRRQEISRETRRLFLLFLAGVLLLTLCACSGGNKAGESGAGNTAVDENTLDYAFSMMTNFAAEACVEKLKSLGDDPEAADWLSFVTAVQEDRFDDAKALFLRLTETWGPEMKTLTEGRLHGLARFINRLCEGSGVSAFRYLCLVQHAGRESTGITDLCVKEKKSELFEITRFSASSWHAPREDYERLLSRCGTDPAGAVLIAVDTGNKEVIVWTGLMGVLPEPLFSDDPAQIEYLLTIDQGSSYQGTYDNNTKAYERSCTVTLRQVSSGKILYSKSAEAHKAPVVTTGTSTDTYGAAFTFSDAQGALYEALSMLLEYRTDGYCFLPKPDGTAVCALYTGEENELSVPGSIRNKTVTELGESFAALSGIEDRLVSVELPDSVTKIGNYAFNECAALVKIRLSGKLEAIGSYAFRKTALLTSVEFPETCTKIGSNSFEESGIAALQFPAGMEEISSYCFTYCKNLTTLVIPGTVQKIGTHAFAGCSGLTSVTIGEGCREIGSYVFYDCGMLQEAVLPKNIEIGTDAFYGCELLKR